MIKLIGILALITSYTVFAQTAEKNTETENINNWKSIVESNYSIEYPDNWELNKSGQMGSTFVLFSPLSSKQDKFKDNVNLIIQDLTGYNLDLDKYVKISEGQIKTLITNGEILENQRITTETIEFQKVIYTGKQGIYNLKFEQYFWVIGNNAFILTLTCEENQFEVHKEIGEKILNSFKINKN